MLCIALLVLPVCVAIDNKYPSASWSSVKSKELVLESGGCHTVGFHVPRGFVYHVSLTSNHPTTACGIK